MWLIASIIGGVFVIGLLSEDPNKNKRKKKKNKQSNNLVIDATKEMKAVNKYLTAHYLDFCNYDEILNIPEADRLNVMQTVWKNWEYHGTLKKLIKQFPDYNKEDLEVISQREMKRVYAYHRWQEDKNNFGSNGILVRIKLHTDWRTRICDIKDEIEVFNYYIDDEDEDIYFSVMGLKSKLETENVYFWQNGTYLKMQPEEFKQFCKKMKYEYPFFD